jgi:hypothetical protein
LNVGITMTLTWLEDGLNICMAIGFESSNTCSLYRRGISVIFREPPDSLSK